MTAPRNAYSILGLDPDANGDQIDGAFKRLAKALHPDVNKRPTAEQEFKNLNWAKSTLQDSMARREHDYALIKVAAASQPDDAIDAVLDGYAIDKPKKKKKKKKRAVVEEEAQGQHYVPPPMPPRPYIPAQDEGFGRGEFESIPPGYDADDRLGGIV